MSEINNSEKVFELYKKAASFIQKDLKRKALEKDLKTIQADLSKMRKDFISYCDSSGFSEVMHERGICVPFEERSFNLMVEHKLGGGEKPVYRKMPALTQDLINHEDGSND